MHSTVSLHYIDYIVIALILLVSLGIGVLFAVKDFKNVSRDEYLLGGRRMFMFPVALSIFATFTSGISLVGAVTDVYMYGTITSLGYLGNAITAVLISWTIVPLMYPLRLTSVYEYLQMRFDSVVVRKLAVIIGLLQTLFYMAIALLSPALALQAGTAMPMWISVGILGFVGTVYTAMGGIKSVVWTDAIQSIVMLGGILIIIIKGNSIVGGGSAVWEISMAGERMSLKDSFSPDPRSRNTWWSEIIGGGVVWFGLMCSQSSLQRISAMKSMNDAKNAFYINGVINALLGFLIAGLGLVVYAYFVHVHCDPFQAGLISNANQLPPYFVLHAMKDWPGIGGVYVAMLFSASLSTVSSGINALAAITVEDLIKKQLENVKEATATGITKVLVFVYGILIIGLAYGANSVDGPISQMFATSIGVCSGPVLGIFLLGALFPWTNKYGAISGCFISIVISMWIALGNKMYGVNEMPLPFPPTDMCRGNNSENEIHNGTVSMPYLTNMSLYSYIGNLSSIENISIEEDNPQIFRFYLYDICFEWYGVIGTLISLILGVTISYVTRRQCKSVTDEKLLFPFVRKFWLSKSHDVVSEKYDEDTKNSLLVSNSVFKKDPVFDNAVNENRDHQMISQI